MPDWLDEAGLDLVAAMQVAPRAGVRVLAEVLATSPSTVSRRLGRLAEDGLLKVVGRLNWSALARVRPQHLWISAAPGAAGRVAREVAMLPETQFAAVTSGRADVYCFVHPMSRAENADLVTERIGSIPQVVASQTEIMLRPFTTAARWQLDRLTEAQKSRLREENPVAHETGSVQLSEDERRVANVLREDGRTGAAEIARQLGMSQSTAYRLAQDLLERGIVVPQVQIDPAAVGFPLEAVISLATDLRSIAEDGPRLAERPSARFVSMVAGTSSLIYYGVFRDEDDLAEFLTDDLGSFEGIKTLEIAVVLRVLKRDWLLKDSALPGKAGSSIGERPHRTAAGQGKEPWRTT
jgi:DNA-binding Lrp family transcriptional regulator